MSELVLLSSLVAFGILDGQDTKYLVAVTSVVRVAFFLAACIIFFVPVLYHTARRGRLSISLVYLSLLVTGRLSVFSYLLKCQCEALLFTYHSLPFHILTVLNHAITQSLDTYPSFIF